MTVVLSPPFLFSISFHWRGVSWLFPHWEAISMQKIIIGQKEIKLTLHYAGYTINNTGWKDANLSCCSLDACFRACSAAVKPNVSYCWDVSKALPPISCNGCPNCQQIDSHFHKTNLWWEITFIGPQQNKKFMAFFEVKISQISQHLVIFNILRTIKDS